jgi:hypothetical protein
LYIYYSCLVTKAVNSEKVSCISDLPDLPVKDYGENNRCRESSINCNHYLTFFSSSVIFNNSAHLHINSICSFVAISSGFDFLELFGGIDSPTSSEQIADAFFDPSIELYSAQFEKLSFVRANILPLLS